MSETPGQQFTFGPYRLDCEERLLLRDGKPLALTPKSFDTLVVLVARSGHLVEKDELMRLVWAEGFVEESNLANNIYALRKLLGQGFIETVPTRGYRFTAPVQTFHPEAVVVEKRTLTRIVRKESEAESRQRRTPLNWRLPALVLFLGTAGFILYPRIQPRQEGAKAAPFGVLDVSRLTTSGRITHAAISPNGRYVAHVVQNADGNSVWVRHVDVPSHVRVAEPALTEMISVVFAPDSQTLTYITLDHDKGDTKAYRVPVLGGRSEFVAEGLFPFGFSPDAKQIAFARMRRTESTLVVADADGSNEKVLSVLQKPDFFEVEWNAPAWSPDGKTIACPVNLNDGRGRYGTLVGVNPETGKLTPLTSMRWNYVGQAVWLPDGLGLLLTASDRPGTPMQVWHLGVPGGTAARITNDVNNYRDLSLTDDGRRLAAVQVEELSNIWVSPVEDRFRSRQIGSERGHLDVLAWTPDGRIVYRSGAGGGGADVWIMKSDGSDAKQLTFGARATRGLAVTPDARHIVFVSDRTGRFNLWRVDTDGGNLRQLTVGDGEYYPHCTSDGKWVVYQSGEVEPRVWKVPLAGGRPVQLSETRATKPAVSPDGRKVAYSYLDVEQSPKRWGVGIISSEGGPLLQRFDFPPTVVYRSVRWSPDGRSIAFVNNVGGRSEIWVQPFDGSPPRQLTQFGAEQILAFDWSPDGRFLSYVRHLKTSDVVLMGRK